MNIGKLYNVVEDMGDEKLELFGAEYKGTDGSGLAIFKHEGDEYYLDPDYCEIT